MLATQRYDGPLVFENPPHANALDYLSQSFDYIRGLEEQEAMLMVGGHAKL